MNDIVAAILSNLSYAFEDNGNGLIARKNSPLKVATWIALTGVILFTPLLFLFPNEIHRITPINLLILVAIELLVNIGYLSFVTGMSKGSITLTGVIGGSFPAVTTITALIFFNETVTIVQAASIVIILVGIVLSSLHSDKKTILRELGSSGLLYAFGAFFFWGVYFALIRIPIERIGWFLPQYASSVIALPMFLLLGYAQGQRGLMKKPNLLWVITGVSALQILGGISFNYAISKGPTAIVAPIAGSSPAVFALLAFFIFREKLQRIQWLGVALSIAGIVALSALSN